MKKEYILILGFAIMLFGFTNNSDKKVFEEQIGKSYHPIKKGQTDTYIADFNKYTISFDTNFTEIRNKKYLKQTTDYNGSQTIAYYREEDGDILYIKPDQINETIEIPKELKTGFVWYESDSTWKYTIKNSSEHFETPISVFKNCLVIQAENIDKNKSAGYYQIYLQYYQRGRGYVGTKVGGLIYSYLTPSD